MVKRPTLSTIHDRATELYLRQLTQSQKLLPAEELELKALLSQYPAIRKKCSELDEIYQSEDMKLLLRLRSTDSRMEEIHSRILKEMEDKHEILETRLVRRFINWFDGLFKCCLPLVITFCMA